MKAGPAPARALALAAWLGLLQGPAGTAGAQPLPAERQTRHALIIGIGEYADPEVPALRGIVHDVASARRMARAMAVPDAQVTLLRAKEATACLL